jgi:hypothetical protein
MDDLAEVREATRESLAGLARSHLPADVADTWISLLRAGLRLTHWLIRPEDLAARRFDKALFTWQCC